MKGLHRASSSAQSVQDMPLEWWDLSSARSLFVNCLLWNFWQTILCCDLYLQVNTRMVNIAQSADNKTGIITVAVTTSHRNSTFSPEVPCPAHTS